MAVKVSKAIGDQWVVARGVQRIAGPYDTKKVAIKAARREAKAEERITADKAGSYRQEVIRQGS